LFSTKNLSSLLFKIELHKLIKILVWLNYSMQFLHLAFILRSGLRGTLLQYLRQKILNFLKITEELLYVIALERYSIRF
jgi:hypothetical protein